MFWCFILSSCSFDVGVDVKLLNGPCSYENWIFILCNLGGWNLILVQSNDDINMSTIAIKNQRFRLFSRFYLIINLHIIIRRKDGLKVLKPPFFTTKQVND